MDAKKKEELIKAMCDKGMSMEDAKEMVEKALPEAYGLKKGMEHPEGESKADYAKHEAKETKAEEKAEHAGGRGEKDELHKGMDHEAGESKAEEKAEHSKEEMAKNILMKDPAEVAKAVDKLRKALDKPAGLDEEEVEKRIAKAVSAVKAPLQQHAIAIAEMTDMLLKSHEKNVEMIQKSVVGLADAVKGLAVQQKDLQGAVSVESDKIAKAVTEFQVFGAHLEELKKSISLPAVEAPRSVQAVADIISHPGDEKVTNGWTKDEVLKKAIEINKTDAEKANNIRFAVMGGSKPDTVAKQFGLTK